MLPEELEDMTLLLSDIRRELASRGYKEIHTPALEYESVMAAGDLESAAPAFRFLDEEGRTLVLRSDMTVPTARLVATRMRDKTPPFRLYYVSHIYRGKVVPGHARASGQAREFLQLGAELIGSPGLSGTLELLELAVAALDGAGLNTYSIVLGDATLYPRLMSALGISDPDQARLSRALSVRDFVDLEQTLDQIGERSDVSQQSLDLLSRLAQTRGGADVFEQMEEVPTDLSSVLLQSAANLRRVAEEAAAAVRARLVIDFGMSRELGYYSGEIFEVHHPAVGQPIGGGGRYDGLLARFGESMPAIGFGVSIEDLHAAKLAEDAETKPDLETAG
jgi:ATP phosphoribosyltransferase regulatory subunit HisZ